MKFVASIRCLTFDLDDTLWDCAPVIAKAEQAMHTWLTRDYPRITAAHDLDNLREHRESISRANPDLRHDVTALRLTALRALAAQYSYPASMAEEGLALFRSHRNRVQLYPQVVPLLKNLRRHYVLGAISNGNADLKEIGIADLFDFTVFAAEVGAAKPNPAVFLAAAERAKVQPNQVAHIGDDPFTDVLGAAEAGLRAIWFNPSLKPWPGGRQPDLVIRSLNDLEGILMTGA